jgi:hypothetical protein
VSEQVVVTLVSGVLGVTWAVLIAMSYEARIRAEVKPNRPRQPRTRGLPHPNTDLREVYRHPAGPSDVELLEALRLQQEPSSDPMASWGPGQLFSFLIAMILMLAFLFYPGVWNLAYEIADRILGL